MEFKAPVKRRGRPKGSKNKKGTKGKDEGVALKTSLEISPKTEQISILERIQFPYVI